MVLLTFTRSLYLEWFSLVLPCPNSIASAPKGCSKFCFSLTTSLLVSHLPKKSKSHYWTFQSELTDIICCCFVYVCTAFWLVRLLSLWGKSFLQNISHSTEQILNKHSLVFLFPSKDFLSQIIATSCLFPTSRVRFAWAVLLVLLLVGQKLYLQNIY